MFKVTEKTVPISGGQYNFFWTATQSLEPDYLCVNVKTVGKSDYSFTYLEVESTALHIPIYHYVLHWLDVESGYIYYGESASPFYIPIYDLKRLLSFNGLGWETFLTHAMDNFEPVSGLNIADAIESMGSSFEYQQNKSLSYNFLHYNPNNEDLWDNTNSTIKDFYDHEDFISNKRKFQNINLNSILGEIDSYLAPSKRRLDYLLLENSFQSPLMKDLMNSLVGSGVPTATIVQKMEDSGILSALKSTPERFTRDNVLDFLTGYDEFKKDDERKLQNGHFPYQIVVSQIEKLVRRLKIKGIV